MYDKCPRFRPLKKSGLGPGSYSVYVSKPIKNIWPPFHSAIHKDAKVQGNPNLGPTTYFSKFRKLRIKGGQSLRYTSAREIFKPKQVISPLAYDPTCRTPIRKRRDVFKVERGRCLKDTKYQSVTLRINVLKELQFLKKPTTDFFGETCQTTVKYKGNKWSTREEKRFKSNQTFTPGPGMYYPFEKKLSYLKQWDENYRSHQRHEFCSLRFPSRQPGHAEIPEGQDPSRYNINYDFIYKRPRHNMKNIPFMSSNEWGSSEDNYPGPADYNVKQLSKPQTNQPKNVAFMKAKIPLQKKDFTLPEHVMSDTNPNAGPIHMDQQKSKIICHSSVRFGFPTPGYWTSSILTNLKKSRTVEQPFVDSCPLPEPKELCDDVTSIHYRLAQKLRRRGIENIPPFGSLSKTFWQKKIDVNDTLSGPGRYTIVDIPKKHAYFGYSQNSTLGLSDRFPEMPDKKMTPSPCQYNLDHAFKAIYTTRTHNRRRVMSFMTTVPRDFKTDIKPYVPSPGRYHPDFRGVDPKPGGRPMYFLDRWKQKTHHDSANLGPGTYNIHPTFSSSMYRPTFNVTLKNESSDDEINLVTYTESNCR